MNFRCKFRHRRSIRRPRFPIRVKISAIWRHFQLILHFICWMSAIFLLPVCLTYWPRKYTTRVDPHVDIILTKFEVDMTIHCRVIAFVCGDTSRDFVTLTFDLLTFWQLKYMAGHVTNFATKFEDPTPIRSWVTSYNASHWLPLKMRTPPPRMRRITWPASRGSKTITFLESPPPICLYTMQLRWLYGENN